MGDTFTLRFQFGLEPSLSAGVIRTLTALAKGEAPRTDDLGAVPEDARGWLASPDVFTFAPPVAGVPLFLWETGHSNVGLTEYHAPLPTHRVALHYQQTDDGLANGGFALPFALFDLVGEHGLFGTESLEGGDSRITCYYREFDDLLIARLEAPTMAYPLPPAAAKAPDGYLRGWSPSTEEGFEAAGFRRYGKSERASVLAEARSFFEPPA